VQRFVRSRTDAASATTGTNLTALVRDYVLGQLEKMQVECGAGFRGFLRRSSSRCRREQDLHNSRNAADATIVIHHSHLLDPQTGKSTVGLVKHAFAILNQEFMS
jgi:hypothetical protein